MSRSYAHKEHNQPDWGSSVDSTEMDRVTQNPGLTGAQYGNAAAQERLASSTNTMDDTVRWGADSQTARTRASAYRYAVVPGDTLIGLTRRAGQTTHEPLYNLNRDRMPDANTINVGQVLVLPVGWVLPGMVNDPNNLTGDPLAQSASNTYMDTSLYQGTQVDSATGAETGAPADALMPAVAGARSIQVLRSGRNPITVPQGGTAPSDAQLYKENPKGTTVQNTRGTAAAPNTYAWADESTMFIGGAPAAADVRQGGLGDCYFLSTVLGIVEGDPGKISQMMSFDGTNVTTTFKRYDSGAAAWVDCKVTCTSDLQVRSDFTLKGAGARIGSDPSYSKYSADTYSGDLEVDRNDYYEMGLWAPLMEKCYARFAEQHGRYGMGAGTGSGGYDIINAGGGSEEVYQIFYGGDATAFTETVNFAAGGDLVALNYAAIERLVEYSNTQQNPGAGGGTETFMHARIGGSAAAQRCVDMIDQVVADWWVWPWQTDTLTPALNGLKTSIQTWQASNVSANFNTMLTTARTVSTPGTTPELWDESNGQDYRDLLEIIKIVSNFDIDSGSGARSLYAAHAYHVKDVFFKDGSGGSLALTGANLSHHIGNISDAESSVVLENPHARGEMDLDGNGPDQDSNNEGRFEISLHSFLNNVDLLRGASVNH